MQINIFAYFKYPYTSSLAYRDTAQNRCSVSILAHPMGGFWSIFSYKTFRISYWNIVEQFKTLRSGVGAIWKITFFLPDPLSKRHCRPCTLLVVFHGINRGGEKDDTALLWFIYSSLVIYQIIWGKRSLQQVKTLPLGLCLQAPQVYDLGCLVKHSSWQCFNHGRAYTGEFPATKSKKTL